MEASAVSPEAAAVIPSSSDNVLWIHATLLGWGRPGQSLHSVMMEKFKAERAAWSLYKGWVEMGGSQRRETKRLGVGGGG